MFYYDPYYWIILVPAFLISLLAQIRVSSTFGRLDVYKRQTIWRSPAMWWI